MSILTERMQSRSEHWREMRRLATFADLSQGTDNNVCPLTLARLGFTYNGRDNAVVCAHCQTEIRGWTTGDDVRKKHGSCLQQQQQVDRSNEIPSILGAVRQHLPTNSRTERSPPTNINSKRDVRDASGDGSTPNVTTSTIVKSNSPFYEVCVQVIGRASRKDFSSIYSNTADLNSESVILADVIIDRSRPDFERLKVESARLATFHDWPARATRIVEPRDLAKAGMFYTGQTDRVQCAFCRGYLRNWVEGDTPAEEHRNHFPDCPFVQNSDIGTFDVVDNSQLPNQYVVTSSQEAPTMAPRTGPAAAGRQRPRPKHPDYSQLQQRKSSFCGKQVPSGQNIDVLALAGFFHVGPTDNVRCFYCDGGLKHWQPSDDPWTEHRRWFPRCPYVMEHGEQLPNPRNAAIATDPVVNADTNLRDMATRNVQYRVEPREIKARLDSPTVVSVMELGYSRDLVRRAIERRLTTMGDDFPDVASLMETVHELQAERERAGVDRQDSRTALPSSTSGATMSLPLAMQAPSSPFRHQRELTSKDESVLANRESSRSSHTSVAGRMHTEKIADEETTLQLEENRRLKEARTCKVCMDRDINMVFLPCGHLVCCESCAKSLSNCPICRNVIRGTVKTFLA